jgi:4-amino-4-deoxy-L-arabinose transferase-like glycosyltransferase
VAVVLTLLSTRYGYHRDELYFRMLDPAWGYVDQPPLVPFLARLLGDEVWLLRLPATACAAASVVLVALLCREVGGGRTPQAFVAWAYAGTTACLDFGHVLLTSTLDLVLWPLVVWLVVRAELRSRPRLWLVAGLVAGLASYAHLLVAVLLAGIALGLLLVGPRRRLLDPYVLGGGVLATLVALPNAVYQATHDWPQLAMGDALAENNAGEVRWFMWLFLVIVLGPVLVPVWWSGLVGLWRREEWRPVRFLVPASALVVLFTFVGGTQPHYPTFVLVALLGIGAAALGDRLAHRGWWVAAALNAAVAVVVSLPVLPLGVVGRTPVPDMNQLIADQVGWPAYVAQVQAAWDALPAEDRAHAVVLTGNYGEAGALARFAPDLPVASGQNALHDQTRPPDDTDVVVTVGWFLEYVRPFFGSCEVVDELDDGVDVVNEEQGAPVAVCRDPVEPWPVLWPRLRHLD